MKNLKFMLWYSLVIISLTSSLLVSAKSDGASKKHAYTLDNVSILDRKGKPIASVPKGTTFSYVAENLGYVKIKYKGKDRYVSTKSLVLDAQFATFVSQNKDLFDSKLNTIKNTVIYRDRKGNKVLRKVSKNVEFCYYGEYEQFYKVQLDGKFGYLNKSSCKKVCMIDVTEFPAIRGNNLGVKIANYGKRFAGNPYVWGGTSLTAGCDCSGFVQAVYKQFGYKLPRCSYQQAEEGDEVSFRNLKPGDLIFYYRGSKIGHVTLYIGNGNVVQARGSAYGIVITRYDYSTPAFAKRIIK